VTQCEPPTNWSAVVLHVDRVTAHVELIEQVLGEIRQRVEGVGEIVDGRSTRQAETEVIGCDHVVAIGQQRYEIAEHERAGGKPVQQHHRGSLRVTGLPIEDLLAVDGGVTVVNPTRHD
jgi:hypothetical protein